VVNYTDPATGFVIAPPFQLDRRGRRHPDRPPAIRRPAPTSGWTIGTPPGPLAVGAWQDQEKSFTAQYPGYRRLQLVPATFGASPAPCGSSRYPVGGALLHAADLGFITGR